MVGGNSFVRWGKEGKEVRGEKGGGTCDFWKVASFHIYAIHGLPVSPTVVVES